ncbi:hypothetical protein TCDM_00575 [Trypanosoma cruzi Dm28c]|uniref:Uncharacterized protein n=1 Tax=Trypanosoma cruzi Dm28c TaxID=1416333 RepID=V5DTN5_TRYCR|nr:hypothetical protein TCDM_00575 [Trypanosoma cruzi Dm28c]
MPSVYFIRQSLVTFSALFFSFLHISFFLSFSFCVMRTHSYKILIRHDAHVSLYLVSLSLSPSSQNTHARVCLKLLCMYVHFLLYVPLYNVVQFWRGVMCSENPPKSSSLVVVFFYFCY